MSKEDSGTCPYDWPANVEFDGDKEKEDLPALLLNKSVRVPPARVVFGFTLEWRARRRCGGHRCGTVRSNLTHVTLATSRNRRTRYRIRSDSSYCSDVLRSCPRHHNTTIKSWDIGPHNLLFHPFNLT